MSILTGIALVILGVVFIILKGHISIWLAIVILLGVIDVGFGVYIKNR
ncbi:hypothetical protein SAMN02910315_01230 [Methanobrevibacter millerae]|uniref:Uncharacterized protein n=2 Tax=Methanobrevibacter millerae TaxID=230361 RepID=A0A1G5W7V1_9EURY|nr:hypothetical protein SAMN02910315_01230 [Methanobrevibacter millerae]